MVVAPDFLVDAQSANRLVKYVDADSTGAPTSQDVRDPKIGDVTLVYHVTPAIDRGRKFEDHVGRQILWIEGVVLKGTGAAIMNADAVLSTAHECILEDYRRFWKSEADATVTRSKSFNAELKQKPNPPSLLRRYPRLQLAALLLIAIGVILFAWRFLDKTAPDIKKLRDARGESYSLKTLNQDVVLLIMGDSNNREKVDEWANEYWRDYRGARKIKAFVILEEERGGKRNAAPIGPSVDILFDPEGNVHRAYGANGGQPCLYLIDSERHIVLNLKGDFSPGRYQALQKRIEQELDKPSQRRK
jgi:hypothetical protein